MNNLITEQVPKVYYHIDEVSRELDVSKSAIHFWEKYFGNLHTYRSKAGKRLFTLHDVERLRYVTFLVKKEGYTIKGALKKFKERYK